MKDSHQMQAAGADEARVMADNPLDEVLEGFYKPATRPAAGPPGRATVPGRRRALGHGKPKPTHYKIVSISLYQEDIERLEAMVAELKRRGHTKANKSQLIRAALDQVDLDRIPKGY